MVSIIVVIVTLYIISQFTQVNSIPDSSETLGIKTEVKIENHTPEPTLLISLKPSTYQELVLSPSASSSSTPQITKTSNTNTDEWIYPGSSIISKSNNSLSLESTSNPDDITNWYKEKIESKGFNAKSFVSTKTNGNVLNKLSGVKTGQEVSIEITKESGGTSVKINVSFN